MSFVPCNITNCIYQTLVLDKSCRNCRLHLCYYHYEGHVCSAKKNPDGSHKKGGLEFWYEPEVTQVMAMVKADIIKAEVETLRPGHKVSEIYIPEVWKKFALGFLGSCNFHVQIEFTDGESWLMRIRRRAGRQYPDAPLKLNMASEVATNKALHAAGVAVPNAYLRPSDSQHHDKLVYCYQTFIPGDWIRDFAEKDKCDLPLDSKATYHMQSLVQWFLSMEKVNFDKVGSLCFTNEGEDIIVGPLIERHPTYITPPFYQGPFKTAKDRWIATIDIRLSFLRSRHYCSPSKEIKFYLILMETRNLVNNCKEMENPGPFYIKHDDDRYDHIRAKEDGEVTCILDWEWAYTTNKEEAFAAPTGFVPSVYKDGTNDILSARESVMIDSYNAQNRPDLANYVKNGRKYHRLIDLLRHNNPNIKTVNALERAYLNLPDDHPGQPATMEEWLEVKKEKYKEDEGLRSLLAKD